MENFSDEQLLAKLYLQAAVAKEQGFQVSLLANNPLGPLQFVLQNKKIILSQRNWFYADNILRSFDFFFDTIVPTEVGGFLVADFSQPGWQRTIEGEDFYFTSLPESDQTSLFAEYLKPQPGEIALDLGAYCGRSATALSRMVGPKGRVLSYEADPRNFMALVENVKADKFSNVTPVNKAVWASPQSLWFSSEANMGSHVILTPEENRDDLVEVTGTNLQGIMDENRVDRFDIVKLDVEGAEYDILEGSVELITKSKARWLIEAHRGMDGSDVDVARIRRVMEECGYMTFQLQPPNHIGVYCEPRIA